MGLTATHTELLGLVIRAMQDDAVVYDLD